MIQMDCQALFSLKNNNEIFFLIFPENKFWYFMQIVMIEDNLHEMSNPVFLEK